MNLALDGNQRNYWQKIEDTVIGIIRKAIDLMCAENSLPREEDELNRKFYSCLVEANYQLQKDNSGLDFHPMYEALNQPSLEHSTKQSRENKRPDFQWSFAVPGVRDALASARQFVLECKRLDIDTRSWNFVGNYVYEGVERFVRSDYAYGFNSISSGMLGYIQANDYSYFQVEVNKVLASSGHALLDVTVYSANHSELLHLLATEHSLQSIKLIHCWANLVHCY